MKIFTSKILFWNCLISILITHTLSFRIKGNYLYDLESKDESGLKSEAVDWIPSSLTDGVTKVYNCNGVMLLGGYGILQTDSASLPINNYWRKYAKLPPHTFINLKFKMYPIDKWDGDRFLVVIDQHTVSGFKVYKDKSTNPSNLCGDSTVVDSPPINVEIEARHNSSSLTFMIGHMSADSTAQSLGLRDIEMKFSWGYIEYPSICGRSTYTLPDGACS